MTIGALIVVVALTPAPQGGSALALARELEHDDWRRSDALWRLRQLGSDAAPVLPALLCVIEEEIPNSPVPHGGDSNLRDATEALSAIGPGIIPPILQVLDAPCGSPVGAKASSGRSCRLSLPPNEEDGRAEYCEWVRYRLASALGGLDPQVIPDLVAAFRQPGPRRPYLAHALGLFGPLGTAAISELVAGLDGADTDLQLQCAEALGEIGPAARGALPALRSLLANQDDTHKWTVREAIRKIEQESP